jgi:hypothetical protein
VSNLTGSGSASSSFGAVALSSDGTTLAVGEYGANAVWIYTANPVGSGNWTLQRKLLNSDAGFVGPVAFGFACALSASGDTLVVGAFSYNGYNGSVTVFSRTAGGVWSSQSGILANGTAGSQFGITVRINGPGDRIAVGARLDSTQGTENGAVYIYTRGEMMGWNLCQRVLPSDSLSLTGRWFGSSLSLSFSGDALVVGAPFERTAAGMITGAWWYFEWNGTLFLQSGLRKVGQPTVGGAKQGASVALSADGQTVIGKRTAASAPPPAAV